MGKATQKSAISKMIRRAPFAGRSPIFLRCAFMTMLGSSTLINVQNMYAPLGAPLSTGTMSCSQPNGIKVVQAYSYQCLKRS